MHVRFQDTAEQDLDDIKNYLEPRSPQGLDRILTAIFTVSDQIALFPFLGREGDINGTRELSVPRTPFMLVYVLNEPEFVDIIRVIHEKREYPPKDD